MANVILSICYEYSAAVKNASWEVPRITEEVKSLRNALEALESLAEKAECAEPAAKTQLPTLMQLCEPLAMLLEELQALERKLAPPSWSGQVGSRRRSLIQALGWPMKEADTKRTLENIRKFTNGLSFALSVDQT